MGLFSEASKVESLGNGVWGARLDGDFGVADKPNGGYLVSLIGRATCAELEGAYPHPLATSSHFLAAPPWESEVSVRVEVLRRGRRAAQARATLLGPDGTPCVETLLTLGTLNASAQPWYDDAPPVELPEESACFLMPDRPPNATFVVHITRAIEERLDPACLGFALSSPNGVAELRGWARLAGGAEWDPIALLVALDCYPPATFPLGALGWVPTLELTTYLRALPAPGPIRVRQRARLIEDGWVDEACDIWDSRGRLVAQATQLAGVRIPEGQHPAARRS